MPEGAADVGVVGGDEQRVRGGVVASARASALLVCTVWWRAAPIACPRHAPQGVAGRQRGLPVVERLHEVVVELEVPAAARRRAHGDDHREARLQPPVAVVVTDVGVAARLVRTFLRSQERGEVSELCDERRRDPSLKRGAPGQTAAARSRGPGSRAPTWQTWRTLQRRGVRCSAMPLRASRA